MDRVSGDQLEILLDHLQSHRSFARGFGLGARSKATVEREWQGLASKLNAVGSGSTKDAHHWKRYWIGLKHRVKEKAAALRKELHDTGNRPGSRTILSEQDKKVLAILGEPAVVGDRQYAVPIFGDGPSTSNALPMATQCYADSSDAAASPVLLLGSAMNIDLTESPDAPDLPIIETPTNKSPTNINMEEDNIHLLSSNATRQNLVSRPRRARSTRNREDAPWRRELLELERRRVAFEESISNHIESMANGVKAIAESMASIAATLNELKTVVNKT